MDRHASRKDESDDTKTTGVAGVMLGGIVTMVNFIKQRQLRRVIEGMT